VEDPVPDLFWILSRLDYTQVIDVLIVALIFYLAFLAIRGTRAVQLLWGVGLVLFVLVTVSSFFQLTSLNWLIKNSIPALLVGIPVIFQPELRRIFERLGRAGGMVALPFTSENGDPELSTIDEIARACARLAERRHGALIILERNTGLQDYVDTGVRLDALISAEMLVTVFFPNTPLHDGAVIVRGNHVCAASCILPLAEAIPDYPKLGTRHRAAVGITEDTDALAIVVSEQTGTISLGQGGRLTRSLDEVRLKNVLLTIYHPRSEKTRPFWKRMTLHTHQIDEQEELERSSEHVVAGRQ
jgi:diadenylate cyclase